MSGADRSDAHSAAVIGTDPAESSSPAIIAASQPDPDQPPPRASRRELYQIGRLRLEKLGVVKSPADTMLPPGGPIEPTDERQRHDPVRRERDQVADSAGGIGRPFRVVDTLARMERNGTITPGMRVAGEAFRDDFGLAQLDALKAADLARAGFSASSRPFVGLSLGHRAELARSSVWISIRQCGGIASPAGSCIWHVLGCGQSLSEWAKTQGWAGRLVSEKAAAGILAAALGVLAEKNVDKRGHAREPYR